MPPTPGGPRQGADQGGADQRVPVGRRVGEDVEGERQQRVAGKDRRRLVEGLVHGRPAAAEVVVVHRRQVVMDEAVGMDAFQRRRGADDALVMAVEEPRRLDDEERAEPLARRRGRRGAWPR